MSLDARARRYFPFIVLAMLALAAWFQASAIGSLIAASVADEEELETSVPASVPPTSPPARSGDSILARNPFDSRTGSLEAGSDPSPSERADRAEDSEPDAGGRCAFGKVALIIAADDPRYSFASIAGTDGKAKMRWVGDAVDDHVVAEMRWDRVYLEKASRRCHLVVGGGEGTREAPSAALTPEPAADDLTSKIEVLSDTERNIDRSLVERIVGGELISSGRMRPVKEGDRVVGLRISRAAPGSLLAALGLRNGDQLQAINGFALTDPEKLLEAQSRLAGADKLSIQMVRDARPMTMELNVR